MPYIKHVLFLLTAISTNPWSHGVASEISQYDRQNQSRDHYELREIHKIVYRSGNESERINQRSILGRNTATRGSQETTRPGDLNQRGHIKELSLLDKVVFPGPTATYYRRFEPEISDECKKLGYCEKVSNYPDEDVTKVVTEEADEEKFYKDKLYESDTPDIAQRVGPPEDDVDLCTFRTKVMYPEALPDNTGKWHLVINPKSKPVQGFKVEVCENIESPCASFVSFSRNYEGRCVQKFVYRHTQTLDENGNMVGIPLKVPSCCSCVGRLLMR